MILNKVNNKQDLISQNLSHTITLHSRWNKGKCPGKTIPHLSMMTWLARSLWIALWAVKSLMSISCSTPLCKCRTCKEMDSECNYRVTGRKMLPIIVKWKACTPHSITIWTTHRIWAPSSKITSCKVRSYPPLPKASASFPWTRETMCPIWTI